jgi:hypothetical protein
MMTQRSAPCGRGGGGGCGCSAACICCCIAAKAADSEGKGRSVRKDGIGKSGRTRWRLGPGFIADVEERGQNARQVASMSVDPKDGTLDNKRAKNKENNERV